MSHNLVAAVVAMLGTSITLTASAAIIPSGERDALIALYNSTGGDGWTSNANWCLGSCPPSGPPLFNAAGTECSWQGVTCGSGPNVIAINLSSNNLIGTLPVLQLNELQTINLSSNALSGNALDATFLNNLVDVNLAGNNLNGVIPNFSFIATLRRYNVYDNALTGSIPTLIGLPNLQTFSAYSNNLTGSIPPLAGLTNLKYFNVGYNKLTGLIPPLNGLANLDTFLVNGNRSAFSPGLTGSIPCLSTANPCSSGLSKLANFNADSNNLSGSIPLLTGLTSLQFFYVGNNRLTGPVPAVPVSGQPAGAGLCPNLLDVTPSANDGAWNLATGTTPWWATPFISNKCDELFTDDLGG